MIRGEMRSLLGRYEMIEMLFAVLLFIPFYMGYLKMSGSEMTGLKVGLTVFFLAIFLVVKNVVINYYIMISQNGTI
jgi:hypothetical protein